MKQPSSHQRTILARIASNPYQRMTAHVFNETCGSSRSVLAMFREGWVEGDGVPATYVMLSAAGKNALAIADGQSTSGSEK